MREYKVIERKVPKRWEDSLPLGNGRMGVTLMCGVSEETVCINEETIWSSRDGLGANSEMAERLHQIRQLFLAGKPAEGDKLANKILGDCFTRIRSYEPAGQLKISLHQNDMCRNYEHTLDIVRGVATVEYDKEGSHITRECFVSYPDDVIAYRVTSDGEPLFASIGFDRENIVEINASEGELTVIGKTVFGDHKFCVKAKVLTYGCVECRNGEIFVSDTNTFTVLVSVATEFRHGNEYINVISFPTEEFETLKKRHIEDFSTIMSRADIQLPEEEGVDHISVTERKRMHLFDKLPDDGFVMLQWQFGRYLLASSSRPGSLPSNLQGVWSGYLCSDWNADYHTNINLQANYWAAETANLSDCHTALFDYMNKYMLESGKETAKVGYKTRGCVVHHVSDIYGFTAPADGMWGIWPHGASWLSYHMWEHYLYTLDKDFLKNDAYEFIRQAAIFFLDNLVESKEGYLVYGPSTSPENRYKVKDENGEDYACFLALSSTMDVAIIGGLFRNFIEASEILGIEDEDVAAIREARKKLPPFKIGKFGQLQEWLEDYEETDVAHRHISHSFGLFPDNAINRQTPELLDAIKVTLERRLSSGGSISASNLGWSLGWLASLYARLRCPDMVLQMTKFFIARCVNTNLWDISAQCFQLDGNMAFVSGVCEALIQSHERVISLIPALPEVWKDGSFRGLRARGGVEVDAIWKDCSVTEFTLIPSRGGTFTVEFPDGQAKMCFSDEKGNEYNVLNNKIVVKADQKTKFVAK